MPSDQPALLPAEPKLHHAGGRVSIPLPLGVEGSAVFGGENNEYRYVLERRWGKATPSTPAMVFIMMNPSVADPKYDDPTVRWCRLYAMERCFRRLVVLNVMAYRATNPKALLEVNDPVGPENLNTIYRHVSTNPEAVVCAWGRLPGKLWLYPLAVRNLLKRNGIKPWVLRLNKDNQPAHPLYIPRKTELQPWNML